jgi:mono/diheme cytochrome c family protein
MSLRTVLCLRLSTFVVAGSLLGASLGVMPTLYADDAISYKNQIQPIFNAQCVFCHVTGAENGGLNLARSLSYNNLVSAPSSESKLLRVVPGKPEDSYLMHKLQGTQLSVGGIGDAMPRTDPPRRLDPAQLELIRNWILQGAPKDDK